MNAQNPQNPAFLPFVNSIYDTDGLLRILDELALVERSLFRDKPGTISVKAKDFTTSSIIDTFVQLEQTGLEPTTDKEQAKFIKDLMAHLKAIEQVKLTIAFAPTNSFLMVLNSQVSAIAGRKVLLDVVINSYVVGGAIFEYKGKVSKQTLDLRLSEALDEELDRIYPSNENNKLTN